MEDVITKSIKFTSCLDKYDNDFSNSKISSNIPSNIPVLSTFLKENPKKNKELETDKKDFKELLDELDLDELDLDELDLDEVITIDYESDNDDILSNEEYINYDYFEIGDGCDPDEIKKLSPWRKNGPIFKKLPDCNEIENFIKNKKCICLLLNCKRNVLINKILVNKENLLNFLCPEHKNEVEERYVYKSNKNI
jgi:hypothetical protein